MAKMIQIRNVPDDVHRRLKSRAADEGLTLSDFLLREARRLAEFPTMRELEARIRSRERVQLSESSAEAIRAERARR